jgi:hypothetical protein
VTRGVALWIFLSASNGVVMAAFDLPLLPSMLLIVISMSVYAAYPWRDA